jgi:hypothetical protein
MSFTSKHGDEATRRSDKMSTFLLIPATILIANTAAAQDGKECFSEITKYNVCEKARDIQRIVAPSLPMKMNANITLSLVAADGPRVVIIAMWRISKPDLDASLRAGGMSLTDLDARMSEATKNAVCAQAFMAAFLRLGGQVQYLYKTEDGYIVLSVVTVC